MQLKIKGAAVSTTFFFSPIFTGNTDGSPNGQNSLTIKIYFSCYRKKVISYGNIFTPQTSTTVWLQVPALLSSYIPSRGKEMAYGKLKKASFLIPDEVCKNGGLALL